MSKLALKLIKEAKEQRLTKLDLENQRLLELPEAIFELVWLEELKISNIDERFSMFQNLKILKISDVFIDAKNLSFVSQIKSLQQLDLSNSNLINLNILRSLSELQILNISRTRVYNLRPLRALLQLRSINISFTEVIDLEPLRSLKHLETLDAEWTGVVDLGPLESLIQLKSINLASSGVTDLSPLKSLNQLRSINISTTRVKDISPLKAAFENKIKENKPENDILFDNCTLFNPPIEIAKQGNESILNYWKQIEEQGGKVELYEAKLIIVGEGGTGKTTLFEKLKDPSHKVGNTPETHGINIHEGLPVLHAHIGNNTFYVNMWDFGGQELQYMTHQFFLTPRALYVLMIDARKEVGNLSYWFKIISLLGRDKEDLSEKVKLLLVFNKRGNSTGQPPQFQDQLQYYEDCLDVQYLEVDFSENDFRFENLKRTIEQSLVMLPIVKSQLPRLWKVIRDELREVAKMKNYITTSHFSDICSKYGVIEEEDQWVLSSYLHQLGSILHFQNDKGLRSLVILNPQWAVDGVYCFLSEESVVRNHGRFTEEVFIQLLAKKYNRHAADVILQLMTKNNFDICYESVQGHYVAAQLLPDKAPDYVWNPRLSENSILQFRYQYPIMPKGLMSRLIVRLSDDIENHLVTGEQIVWKKGVVLHIHINEGECRVRLREDDAESKAGIRQILIDVIGDRDARKYALRRVRDTVEDLHQKWFRSIRADEMVPCCCSECLHAESPNLYKLMDLVTLKKKRPNSICYSSGEDVSIQQLLEGVYDAVEIKAFANMKLDTPKNKFNNFSDLSNLEGEIN